MNETFSRCQRIEKLQIEVRKLIDISKKVHVHRSLLTSLCNKLRHYSISIDHLNKNDRPIDEKEECQFDKLEKVFHQLQEIYLFQYEENWYNYLSNNPISSFLEEINQYVDNINKISVKLKLFENPPLQWDEKITLDENIHDLNVLQNLFEDIKTSNQSEKLNEILSLKNAIIGSPNASKSKRNKFLSRKTIKESLSPFEQWEIDLNEVEFQKKIGSGGFADVYLGYLKTDGTIVAVKQLHQQKFDEYMLEMFQREVTSLSELNHFSILPFVGAHMKPPYCIITEYMNGGSLFYRIHAKDPSDRLTPTKLTIIALGIAYGMSYLHAKQMIHRDLKSLNILLDANDYPKICDFGLTRTKTNEMMTGRIGTCQWMAPEVLSSQKYNEKADVYSYGIILWEMLTGDIPYRGLNDIQIAVQVCKNHSRPKIPRSCPQNLHKFIKYCWNEDPSKRPDFNTICKALEDGTILFPGTDVSALKNYVKTFSATSMAQSNLQTFAQLIPTDIDPYYVSYDDINDMVMNLKNDDSIIPKMALAISNPNVKDMLYKFSFIPNIIIHLNNSNDSNIISYIMLLLTIVLPDEQIMNTFLEYGGHNALMNVLPKMGTILIPRLLDCLIAVIENSNSLNESHSNKSKKSKNLSKNTPKKSKSEKDKLSNEKLKFNFKQIHMVRLAPYLLCTDITQRQLAVYLLTAIFDNKYFKSTKIFNAVIENLLKNSILEAKDDLLTSTLALLLKISSSHKTKEEFKFCNANDRITALLNHSNPQILHLSYLLLQVLFTRYEQSQCTIIAFLDTFPIAAQRVDEEGLLACLNAFTLIMNHETTFIAVSQHNASISTDLIKCALNSSDLAIQISVLRICYVFCSNSKSRGAFLSHIHTFVQFLSECTIVSIFASYSLTALLSLVDPFDALGDSSDTLKIYITKGLQHQHPNQNDENKNVHSNSTKHSKKSKNKSINDNINEHSNEVSNDHSNEVSNEKIIKVSNMHYNDDSCCECEITASALRLLGVLCGKMTGAMLVEDWDVLDKLVPFLVSEKKEFCILTTKVLASMSATAPYCPILTSSMSVLFERCNDNDFEPFPLICLSNMTADPTNAKLCIKYLDILLNFAASGNLNKVERSLVIIFRIITLKEGKKEMKNNNRLQKIIDIAKQNKEKKILVLVSSIIDELVKNDDVCLCLKQCGLEFLINELDKYMPQNNQKIIFSRISSRLQMV
ncbi:TKL family protein kinase [Tritrichomonas foetus]|uniref:TKL family protein kinase n=1 Tax=Tritrichomonas foetus TaxID=1144522 RepID=A0A1J4KHS7_9EUKA|nr:TKL family protein kinase [Tritrichomonas foetus]|eukprot:OHT10763.1 TKL family protein kinase [Tritrichomonas foetus]